MGYFDKIKKMLSSSTTLPEGSCCCSGEIPAHKEEKTSCCSDNGHAHKHEDTGCCGEESCGCDDEDDLTKPSGGCCGS